MSKRFTDTEIWQKEWFLRLSLKHKMLVRFLFDNCDCAGIYTPNFMLLSFFIGEEITADDFKTLKQVKKLDNGNFLIEDFIKFQYGIIDYKDLNPKFSVHKGIIKSLEKNQLLNNPCIRVNQTLQDMDKDKDKDNIPFKDIKEKEKENQEKKKKEDPFAPECRKKLSDVCKKVFKTSCLITREDCINASLLSADYDDFWETLEDCLNQVSRLDFKGYKPNINWLLKEKNYTELRNGVYAGRLNGDILRQSQNEVKNSGLSEEEILEQLRKGLKSV